MKFTVPMMQLARFLTDAPLPDDTEDFIKAGKWKCNECGCCCAWVDWFDIDTDEHGICKYLNKDRRCMIYKDRPKECIVMPETLSATAQAKTCSWIRSNYNKKLEEGGY